MIRKSFIVAFLLISLICFSGSGICQSAVVGTWSGTLGAGNAKLRLVLTITQSGNTYSAALNSLDQGATIPADKVTVDGSRIHADFNRVNGFYEGALSQDGTAINGSWTQNQFTQPLDFKRGEASAAEPKPKAPAGDRFLAAPIDVQVPKAPTIFQSDGKTHLVYELHITNFASENIMLSRVEALSDSGTSLLRLEEADLPANVMAIGNYAAQGLAQLNMVPGQMLNVYMWITLKSDASTPAALQHKITVKIGKDPQEITTQAAPVPVSRDIAIIGPPLSGDNWLAANGPANDSVHRRALIPINGRAQISQRFAIDWVRLNADGNTFTGDPKNNRDYRAYGSNALAVADGVVTEVKDGIPENVPGLNSRAVPITLETIGGNHVIIDIGNGHFAFYAHLQPGSLKVKLGDRVKRGQVIGLVGNSGNSTEPHLHFHLSDANSPLGSEGIPYALESFEAKSKSGAPARKHKMEIPGANEIVTFAEK